MKKLRESFLRTEHAVSNAALEGRALGAGRKHGDA